MAIKVAVIGMGGIVAKLAIKAGNFPNIPQHHQYNSVQRDSSLVIMKEYI